MPFTIFSKTFILDIWQGSEYASELASKVKDVSFSNQFEYQRKQIAFYEGKPKRKSQTNFKIVERKCSLTEVVHIFSHVA